LTNDICLFSYEVIKPRERICLEMIFVKFSYDVIKLRERICLPFVLRACNRSLKVIDLENTLFSKSSHRCLQICTFCFPQMSTKMCLCWELRNFEKFPTKCRRYSPFACRHTASRRHSPFRDP
jgi:hypothetical protein